MTLPTPRTCIRAECLHCLSAQTAGSAHDCLSALCELYPCHPFRGRLIPLTQRPRDYNEATERARIAAHHKRRPRRQPSKAFIARHCRSCQPETRADCKATDCALYPWRPWQPGGVPKRTTSAAQLAAVERAREKLPKPCADGLHVSGAVEGVSERATGRPGLFSGENSAESGPLVEANSR